MSTPPETTPEAAPEATTEAATEATSDGATQVTSEAAAPVRAGYGRVLAVPEFRAATDATSEATSEAATEATSEAAPEAAPEAAIEVTSEGAAPVRAGYGRVLAVPEFRAVFAAHIMSMLGVIVSEIALSVLVYDLTRSALMSALTFALGFLPYAVGGTLLASVADRFPARRVLVTCDLVCAGCVALMVAPGADTGVLLALRCCLAVVAPVFSGTRMATLADVLGDGEPFVLGRSLLRIVAQSALLVGYGLGGLLLTVVSPRHALLVTVATFLASAALLRLGTRHRPARARQPGDPLPGARALFADRRIRVLLLLFWVPAMFSVVPEALAAPYADMLGAGSSGLGLLMCALPVGTVAGELYAGARLGPATRERIALPLLCLTLLPYLGYALRPGLGLSLLLLLLSGAGSAYTLGLDQWFVRAVPEELRGRAMTVLSAGLMTIQGVGMALAGVAAQAVGVRAAVVAAGVLGALCCGGLALACRATESRDRAERAMTGG